MIITRRTVLFMLAAPAVIRTPGLLMPVKPFIIEPPPIDLEADAGGMIPLPPGLYQGELQAAEFTDVERKVLALTWKLGERVFKGNIKL